MTTGPTFGLLSSAEFGETFRALADRLQFARLGAALNAKRHSRLDGREYRRAVLDRLSGVEQQVLPEMGSDQLHALRQAVVAADRHRAGGESEDVDWHDHPHRHAISATREMSSPTTHARSQQTGESTTG